MPRTTRHDILEAGFRLFFERGFARVSMDDIAERAGVTKRTVYHHFASKDALIGAVLDSQNQKSLREFRRWASADAETPEDFIEAIFSNAKRWAQRPRWKGSGFARIALELADLPGHPARTAAKNHKAALEAWLTTELQSRGCMAAGRAARHLAICMEGAGVLAMVQQDVGYIDDAREMALRIVASDLFSN